MTKRRPWLLAVAAGLFAAWIGYLFYLALTAGHPPVVLSRPQFLVADLWVIAEVDDLEHPVKIVEVAYVAPEKKGKEPEPGAEVKVSNLSDCEEGWAGKGRYILPLTATETGYRLTPVPRVGGTAAQATALRVYPDTEETRAQLASLPRS